MIPYFPQHDSAAYRFGEDDKAVLRLLAERYVGANPRAGFVHRTFYKTGILQDVEGQYILDLGQRFPDAVPGQWAYGAGMIWCDEERSLTLTLQCLGPVRLILNGQLLYRSQVIEEISPDAKVQLHVSFVKGWNTLFLKMLCTPAGFGCLIGSEEAKVRILHVLSPFRERAGQAGWVYSKPVDGDRFPIEAELPNLLESSQTGGLGGELVWLPGTEWEEEYLEQPVLNRLYGNRPGYVAYARTRFHAPKQGTLQAELKTFSPTTVWVNGMELLQVKLPGSYRIELHVAGGIGDVLIRSACSESGEWGFTFILRKSDGAPLSFHLPSQIHGAGEAAWLYTGPFLPDAEPTVQELQRLDCVFTTGLEESGSSGKVDPSTVYWQLDLPGAMVRPYYENAMLSNKWTVGTTTNYARWDYPLGVTVYGLLQAGRSLNRPDIVRYAVEHVQACTTMYRYSLWDKEQYGFPSVNQQLVMMKMLDNCGSFGSAMLEAYEECQDPSFLPIADTIADFMLNKLERREDGAFYRTCPGEYSADTMWADDLYMSTPFLIRYAKLSGDITALDEAARQFLRFKEYLYMPSEQIMSHVFDFKYSRATGIPWGRGNGWVLFSLTEVLEVIPEDYEARPALLRFLNELAEGYLALQSDTGLWHQVLNRPETYLEASCTAMFAYAFARGVRFGWLQQPDRYTEAVWAAWRGLTQLAIDRQGNVYGVCSGSRYSFAPDYYNEDLKTVTNDNHGIGIMMLAGTEVAKLKLHLSGADI